jgi:hypothetical protein
LREETLRFGQLLEQVTLRITERMLTKELPEPGRDGLVLITVAVWFLVLFRDLVKRLGEDQTY